MNNRQNLNYLFAPKSIAVIGASRDKASVGHDVMLNLINGGTGKCGECKSFPGKVYAINPNADEILGLKCYPSVTSVKEEVDLAIICVPAKIVSTVVKDCIKKKVRALIVISAGFAEFDEKGKEMQKELVDLCQSAGIAMLGPNSLGVIRPSGHMNASFAPCTPVEGNIAFVSQSGALADSIIDWSLESRYGFSAVVSYGNKAMLDSEDYIEWLATDEKTKAITLYIEGIGDGRRFMEIAKRVNLKKPIVALKAGRTAAGIHAISSHTGSLAGSYEIYSAAFRQCGIEVAETVEELFDTAKALANQPPCPENGIAIVTNGGGCGVLCADYCQGLGVELSEISEPALKAIDRSGKMHPAYSRRNPMDIVGDAMPERYGVAINTLLAEKNVHGLIVIQTLQAMTSPEKDAEVIIAAKKKFPKKPIICVYMGGKMSKAGIKMLEESGIPDYNDLRKAALAMAALIRRGRILKQG